MPKVVSYLPDGNRVTEIKKGDNLLDAMLDKGVPLSYDCKDGVCGSCRTKIIVGKDNVSNPTFQERQLLGHDEVDRGLSRLACQMTVEGDLEIQQYAPRSISTTKYAPGVPNSTED